MAVLALELVILRWSGSVTIRVGYFRWNGSVSIGVGFLRWSGGGVGYFKAEWKCYHSSWLF